MFTGRIYDIIAYLLGKIAGKHSDSLSMIPFSQDHLPETDRSKDTDPVSPMPVKRIVLIEADTRQLIICNTYSAIVSTPSLPFCQQYL